MKRQYSILTISLMGLALWSNFLSAESFLNCFTPNMFKMGKVGQAGYPHPGERAQWYPQQQQFAMAYGQHPMSRLFQPKWRMSLFGPKRWMDWRINAGNMNFYRPGYGYWPPTSPQVPTAPAAISNTLGGYLQTPLPGQFSEQLNLSPYNSIQPNPLNVNPSYQPGSQQSTSNNVNDGWTVPYVSPQSYNRPGAVSYPDNYSIVPGTPSKQQFDYGTKGASGNKQQQQQKQQPQQNQQYGTTKSILIADGGYNWLDAHSQNPSLYPTRGYQSTGFGYAYPDRYMGVVESPVRIAQQLYKMHQGLAMAGIKV